MTRGKIVYIDKDNKVYSTVEFNGDMHPDGIAAKILLQFEAGYFKSYNKFESFASRLNKAYYGYEGELIHTVICKEKHVIDVTNNWTDYLYVVNNSEQGWIIKDQNGATVLDERSLGIVNFQQVERIIHRVLHENTKEIRFELSKDEFVEIVNRLRDSSDLVDKVEELFRNSRDNVECDFCNGAALQISHEGTVVSLLRKLLKDTSEDISYFIYELDYGRKYEPGMITDENGCDIDFSSAEKLYNYLISLEK